MKKMPFILVAAALALGLVLAGCSNPVANTNLTRATTANDIQWLGTPDINAAKGVSVPAIPSLRTNASGPKIPSNAHSADFPGIYFYWDSKQSTDTCYLKVEPWVFQKYVYFILTTKQSNVYTDFTIMLNPGQKASTADGCYVFPIAATPKNINMVFVPEFKEYKAPDEPPYVWTDPIPQQPIDGGYRYVVLSLPGTDFAYPEGTAAQQIDPNDQWFMPGANLSIKAYWNSQMVEQDNLAGLLGIKVNADGTGKNATWIWDVENTAETYGVTGSQAIVFAQMLPVEGTINESYIPFYFACDNAAAVYVNGKLAGTTTWAFDGIAPENQPGQTYDWRFAGYSANDFDGNPWQHVYVVDIAGMLKTGANTIVIVAANSDTNGGKWDETNNPAGLLFSCEFTTTVAAK